VVVVPSISTEDARAKFPKGVTEIRPYLSTTPPALPLISALLPIHPSPDRHGHPCLECD
jgi:hypothetical protein